MKRKKLAPIVAVVLLLFASTYVVAGVDCMIDCVKGAAPGVIGAALDQAEEQAIRAITGASVDSVGQEAIDSFYLNFKDMIKLSPSIPDRPETDGTKRLMLFFVHVLQPIFVIAIIFVGVYIIFASASIKGRAKAKGVLTNLLLGMLLIGLSPFILKAMAFTSHYMASAVLEPTINVHLEDVYATTLKGWLFVLKYDAAKQINPEYALVYGFMAVILATGPMMVMAIRYIVVVFFSVIFPITLFLYFFKPTRGIGRTMLEQTILWNFISVIEALMLVIALYAVDLGRAFPGELPFYVAMTTLILLTVAPLIFISSLKEFLP
ncbi:MAG: hypothetical protein MSIBF_06595 [Candidatus Altiarchaeales archaeon IMC4]|nr:MAG: hypothetical protein MSIBF_06595 [Candidatus Altiarchaeales archaeon IMC4]